MARPRKYKIELTDDELRSLKSMIRKNKISKTIRSRCQIVIDLDEAHGKVLTHEQSAKSNGICLATITNTVKKYFDGGIEAIIDFKRNINSDNARRVLDGRAEARIIELACGPVTEGHSRWTLRLLEEKSKISFRSVGSPPVKYIVSTLPEIILSISLQDCSISAETVTTDDGDRVSA